MTWLLIPLTSPSHGSRAGGRAIPDSGCVWDAGGLRGSKRPLSEEAKKGPAVGTTIQEAFSRQRRRSSAKDAIPDVSTDLEARERPELPTPTEHLHPLHVNREGRPDVPDLADQQQLEATRTAASSNPISSAMLGAPCDADPGSKGYQGDGLQEGLPLVAVESSKQDSASGFVMSHGPFSNGITTRSLWSWTTRLAAFQ